MENLYTEKIAKSDRIQRLVDNLFKNMPEVEAARAVLITQSYMSTENEPIVTRRAKAFENILDNIPIIIRDEELIVGSSTIAPRGCQTYPEFSFQWLLDEFDTLATRTCDPFYISEETKVALKKVAEYWKGKTTSELAVSYMDPKAYAAFNHQIFTTGNYFFNGVGHITVDYPKVINFGLKKVIKDAEDALAKLNMTDALYSSKKAFLKGVILSNNAVIRYAHRYSKLALEMAEKETNAKRKEELLTISKITAKVPENPAETFYEALQSFWFIQQLIQLESSGHSISPGRFDQYMYPFFARDIERNTITREFAQELVDCVWVKLNDLNKCRDAISAEGFAGYSLFQNLIVGGQNKEGLDATNDLSFMCITATEHVFLPQPSFSVRVWNGSPHSFLIRAAELTRTGIGFPAYYNDEVIIPQLVSRGLTIEEARDFNIIGCVEPQTPHRTEGWHDAAFFNMCRPLELVFSNGVDKGVQLGPQTGNIEEFDTFDKFLNAYDKQMDFFVKCLVNSINSIDFAHKERCPLPFESSLVDDCISRGRALQEGGAVHNFSGPQGFGVANVTDSLWAIKKLVYEERKYSISFYKEAIENNFGEDLDEHESEKLTRIQIKKLMDEGQQINEEIVKSTYSLINRNKCSEEKKAQYRKLREDIDKLPKYGNDVEEIDKFARECAYFYTKKLDQYRNPRGGIFQAGMYPVSANVLLGSQVGATPDGRLAHTPVADGVGPAAGRDKNGPTACCNSVANLDHFIISNGSLFNMKFHPTALAGNQGLENFVGLVRGYFDKKGTHMQFNVVSRETLRDAQAHPDKYKGLVVRVAGYSALFTTLSRALQNDIINRTEQGEF